LKTLHPFGVMFIERKNSLKNGHSKIIKMSLNGHGQMKILG